jgi:hypothetical protein
MDALQELLDTCPDGINALDSRGRSPLHLACEKGYFDMAQELANSGADCRVLTSPEGLTALHLMAKAVIDEDNTESALQTSELIVDCGVDVDSMPLPGQAGRNYIMTTNIDPGRLSSPSSSSPSVPLRELLFLLPFIFRLDLTANISLPPLL